MKFYKSFFIHLIIPRNFFINCRNKFVLKSKKWKKKLFILSLMFNLTDESFWPAHCEQESSPIVEQRNCQNLYWLTRWSVLLLLIFSLSNSIPCQLLGSHPRQNYVCTFLSRYDLLYHFVIFPLVFLFSSSLTSRNIINAIFLSNFQKWPLLLMKLWQYMLLKTILMLKMSNPFYMFAVAI